MQTNHADLWLDLHVHADRALTQWQVLHLLRRVDERPERAATCPGKCVPRSPSGSAA